MCPPPPPWKITKIGFLSSTGPDPMEITKLPSQHSMLGHHRHASESPLNGVSLAGRWWPVYSCGWILLSPHQLKSVNVGPPLTNLSGSAHGCGRGWRAHESTVKTSKERHLLESQNRLLYGPQREKTSLRGLANNTGADQPTHPRSLISAFVIRVL